MKSRIEFVNDIEYKKYLRTYIATKAMQGYTSSVL